MPDFKVFRKITPYKRLFHIVYALVAKIYLKLLPNVEVIAITGSVGKTLTQNAINSVLAQKYKVVVGDENLDPTFRIPQTVLKARPWHDFIILEYGVEHPGNMDYYIWLAKPDVAVITNIAPTHTKYLKNVEGVYNEKVKLVKALDEKGIAFLNGEDPMVIKMRGETKADVIWFGRNPDNIDAHPQDVLKVISNTHPGNKKSNEAAEISQFSQSLDGSTFKVSFKRETKKVLWKIIGRHQLLSAYIASSIGLHFNLSLEKIARGLSKVKVPLHRLNVIKTKDFNIIDDSYNSSPKAAEDALSTLIDLGRNSAKIAVLGEMKDLGTISQSTHLDLGRFIAAKKIDYLATIGSTAQLIAKSAKANKFKGTIVNFDNVNGVADIIKSIATKNTNTVVLVKGSRHAHLERIVNKLINRSTEINCYHCGRLK